MFERNGVLYIEGPKDLDDYKGDAKLAYNASYKIYDGNRLYLKLNNRWIRQECPDILSRLWGSGSEVI